MKKRVAINGLGRIGRLVLRHLMESDVLEVAAVNDVAELDNIAYLLRHDSIYPDPPTPIQASDSTLHWGATDIRYTQVADPAALKWRELDVETVIEATGRFTARGEAGKHLAAETEVLRPILAVTDEELVSADIVGSDHSAVVDLRSTNVLGDHTLQVLAWYDNEWGYARRVADLTLYTSVIRAAYAQP